MKTGNIVVIGGANLEYIITGDTEIIPGAKNSVTMEELYGGSGLNYTLRLLATGEAVYPVLFVGHDYAGYRIQSAVTAALGVDNSKIRTFIEESTFLISGVDTPKSTIIVEGSRRTILSHDKNEKNLFRTFVCDRLKQTESVTAVIIGHIHNDKPTIAKSEEDLSTLFAIRYFRDKNVLIYANFGASQLSHGFSFWKPYLPLIDILQLNIYEIKTFFHETKETYPTLQSIVEKLQQLQISAIITLDKFGAIGILKNHYDTLFLARPVELGDKFVDSTGAGDAFCAGMVSALNGKKQFSATDFKEAMEFSRSWAVYACMSYGGANRCPNAETIETFHREIVRGNEVLRYEGERIKDIYALIDVTMELHEI